MKPIKKKTVGIKELKNSAAALIRSVIKNGRPITITKNNQEVAQIVPLRKIYDQLSVLASRPTRDLSELAQFKAVGIVATEAIKSLREDREKK